MLDTKVGLRKVIHHLRGRVEEQDPNAHVDPDRTKERIIGFSNWSSDKVHDYKSYLDIWTGPEVIDYLRDDIHDLSMQRPRDRRGMNRDRRHFEVIQRTIQREQNGLLFLGDDIEVPDGQPLTNQEFSMFLGVHEVLLGE